MSTQFAPIWNNASVDFSCIKANVTDTNSGSNSTLLDLLVGGSSKFKIDKNGSNTISGVLTVSGGATTAHDSVYFQLQAPGNTTLIKGYSTYGRADLTLGASGAYVNFAGTPLINGGLGAGSYSVAGVPILFLNSPFTGVNLIGRDGATAAGGDIHIRAGNPGSGSSAVYVNSDLGLLAQNRAGTGFSQVSASNAYLYNAYTNDSNYERGKIAWENNAFVVGTEKAGSGSNRKLRLYGGQSGQDDYLEIDTTEGWVTYLRVPYYLLFNSSPQIVSSYEANSRNNTLTLGKNGILIKSSDGAATPTFLFGYGASGNGWEVPSQNILIRGYTQNSTNVTNLTGGNISLLPGSGASGSVGAANGGHIYLDGGQGYGTGVHGSLYLGSTRLTSVYLTPTSLTGSQATSALDISQTWNTSGTPTLIKANLTDTASNAASLLMDLQVGGGSKAGITKAGKIFSDAAANLDWFSGRYAGTEYIRLGYQGSVGYGLFSGSAYSGNTGNGFGIGSTVNIFANTTWGSGTSSATFITFSHANNTSPVIKLERVGYTTKPAILIDQTTGTTSYPFEVQLNSVRKCAVASSGNVEIYNAFTNDSNYERGFMRWNSNVFEIGSEKAGTGVTRGTKIILNSDAQAYIDCSDNGYVANFVTRYGTAFSIANAGVVFSRNITMGFEGRCLNITTSGFNSTPSHTAGNTVGDAHFRIGPGWSGNPNAGWYKFLSAYGATPASAGAGGDGGGMSIWLGQGGTANGAFSDGADGSFNLLTTTRTGTVNTSPLFTIDYSGKVTVNNTYTNASNYERAKLEWSSNVFRIGTEKAGSGSARALELQTDGTTRLTIGTTGAASFSSSVAAGGSLVTGLSGIGGTAAFSATQGNMELSFVDYGSGQGYLSVSNGTIRGFLGHTNNADGLVFAAVSNHDFVIRAQGNVEKLRIGANLTVANAVNIAVGTTTGTKIGTATTQKLGFYNATPIVQPTAVADATDAASVITQLNALLSRMRDLGLIAT